MMLASGSSSCSAAALLSLRRQLLRRFALLVASWHIYYVAADSSQLEEGLCDGDDASSDTCEDGTVMLQYKTERRENTDLDLGLDISYAQAVTTWKEWKSRQNSSLMNQPAPTAEAVAGQVGTLKRNAAISAAAGGAAVLLAGLVTGQKMDPATVATTVMKMAIPAIALAMANPLLGIAASFLVTFLGGIFGSKTKKPNMAEQILKETRRLIDQSRLIAAMTTQKYRLLDLADELEWMPLLLNTEVEGGADAQKQTRLSYYIMMQTQFASMKRTVFAECLDDLEGTKCRAWEQAGTILQNILFTNMQLNMLTEIYRTEPAYKTIILDRIQEVGEEYLPLLEHSALTYMQKRLSMLKKFSVDNRGRYRKYKGVCDIIGGHDDLTNEAIYCDEPQKTIPRCNGDQNLPPRFMYCFETQRKHVIRELEESIVEPLAGIREIINVALEHNGQPVPAPSNLIDSMKACRYTGTNLGGGVDRFNQHFNLYYDGYCTFESSASPDECPDYWAPALYRTCFPYFNPWDKVCRLKSVFGRNGNNYVGPVLPGWCWRDLNGQVHEGDMDCEDWLWGQWEKVDYSECLNTMKPDREVCTLDNFVNFPQKERMMIGWVSKSCSLIDPTNGCKSQWAGQPLSRSKVLYDQCYRDFETPFFEEKGIGKCSSHYADPGKGSLASWALTACADLCRSQPGCNKFSFHPGDHCRIGAPFNKGNIQVSADGACTITTSGAGASKWYALK